NERGCSSHSKKTPCTAIRRGWNIGDDEWPAGARDIDQGDAFATFMLKIQVIAAVMLRDQEAGHGSICWWEMTHDIDSIPRIFRLWCFLFIFALSIWRKGQND